MSESGSAPPAVTTDEERPTIHVVAAFTTDAADRVLMVRKHGSKIFMQPGGKPEVGESLTEALSRELAEELLVDVPVSTLVPWGRFEAAAANEPGHRLVADVFGLRLDAEVTAAAEIAEVRWFTRTEAHALGSRLAPLARRMLDLSPDLSRFRPWVFSEPVLTKRLALRPLLPRDIDDVHAYLSREDVARFLLSGPRDRDEVAQVVAEWGARHWLAAADDWVDLAIVRRSDDRVIGHLYLHLRSLENLNAEIGWTLHPDAQGQGFAAEAARAGLRIAFIDMGLHRVYAELDPRNAPSVALCDRLGMRPEGHHRGDLWFKGEWADTGIHAIVAEEFDG